MYVFRLNLKVWGLNFVGTGAACSTGMCRITTLGSTTDRIYDGGPIR